VLVGHAPPPSPGRLWGRGSPRSWATCRHHLDPRRRHRRPGLPRQAGRRLEPPGHTYVDSGCRRSRRARPRVRGRGAAGQDDDGQDDGGAARAPHGGTLGPRAGRWPASTPDHDAAGHRSGRDRSVRSCRDRVRAAARRAVAPAGPARVGSSHPSRWRPGSTPDAAPAPGTGGAPPRCAARTTRAPR